jgi:hypothetical protein
MSKSSQDNEGYIVFQRDEKKKCHERGDGTAGKSVKKEKDNSDKIVYYSNLTFSK